MPDPQEEPREDIPSQEREAKVASSVASPRTSGLTEEPRGERASPEREGWGHLKVSSVPTLLRPEKIDPEACRDLARMRVYAMPGKIKPLAFQLNHPLFFKVDMVGALVNSPQGVGCKGEDVHFEGQLYQNELVLQERRLLVKEENYIIKDRTVESQSDHLLLECPYSELACITGTTTYVWDHLGRDCPLHLICSIRPSLVMDAFLVDHQAQFFINRTSPISIVNCDFETYATNHPALFVSPDPTAARDQPGM